MKTSKAKNKKSKKVLNDLNERQYIFCKEYITNGNNAAAAARVAGYPESRSADLLKSPSIQAEMRRTLKILTMRHEVTADRIIEELAAIAFLDIADVLNDDGTIKPISQIPQKARRAIAGLDIAEIFEREGNTKILAGHLKKFKIHSKEKALELLGKYLGMFTDKAVVEHKGQVQLEHKVDKIDLDMRISQLIEDELSDALQ